MDIARNGLAQKDLRTRIDKKNREHTRRLACDFPARLVHSDSRNQKLPF